jgi:hypothetical protein
VDAGPGAGSPGGDSGAVTLPEAGRMRAGFPLRRRDGRRTAATAAALAATLGLAAASWVVAVRQMSGMDMGPATRLGSLAFFMGCLGGDDGHQLRRVREDHYVGQ